MNVNLFPSLQLGLILLATALPAQAQTVLPGDHSVDGRLCAGVDCTGFETFGIATQKLKSSFPVLLFEDISTGALSAGRDWEILANDVLGPLEYLSIRDVDANRAVFQIEGDTRQNALYVAQDGKLGLGTSLPLADIHLTADSLATIRFESTGTGTHQWEIAGDASSFRLRDVSGSQFPFIVEAGALSAALTVKTDGRIGLGTGIPTAPLELWRPDSFNFFRITARGAGVNESVDITYTGGPLGTGQLRYNIVDGDNQEMSLDADGNMILDGTLTTSGPTCAGGCDRVFDAEYDLPSHSAYADQMYAQGYLPNLSPTLSGAPVNLTEKLGGTINAVEHAHIYLAQHRAEINALQQTVNALRQELDSLRAGK